MKVNEWLKRVNKEIERIKKDTPKDRLEYASHILKCNKAILASCQGWLTWLSSPGILNRFDEEELKTILDEFKSIALEFLDNDLKWTMVLSKKLGLSDITADDKERSKAYIT